MSLHHRFFAPTDVVSDLQWAKARLLDPSAPDDERSHGRVHDLELMRRWSGSGRRPARGGLFCQVIFGPIEPLSCACGALRGRAHDGETCAECSVLCTTAALRSRRHGHIEVRGVLHPALVPRIAETLRLPPGQVWSIARAEAWLGSDGVHVVADGDDPPDGAATGPEALRDALLRAGADALAEVAVLQAIPVPPPSLRPFTGALSKAMIDPWIGPLNEAWRGLLIEAGQQQRLAEIAPPMFVHDAQRKVQELFATVVRMTVSPPPPAPPWPASRAPATPLPLQPTPENIPEGLSTDIVSVLFVDEDRLFIQRPRGSWLVTTKGETLAQFPTCGRIATSVHGSRIRMSSWIGQEWDWLPDGAEPDVPQTSLAVLDLDTGRYLTDYPTDLPQRILENHQPEDLVAGSAGGEDESIPLRWGGDRPGVLAATRDGCFAWVGEGDDVAVLDLDTGAPVLDPVMQGYFTEDDPVLSLSSDEEAVRSDGDGHETATALGITPDNGLRLLHDTGVVSDGERLWFRIDAMILAAGFSPSADGLAVAVGDEIVLLSVAADPAVRGRFPAPGREDAGEGSPSEDDSNDD
ncbi:DNA-directed RNA polymerase beta' subunit protein [Minicystis rosea]|nr:DNA-directed RNA polymerase beta' subunit protein [Minicystis rosea]